MNRSFPAVLALIILALFASPRASTGQVLDLPEGEQHVVVVGNTLWDLAAHFYGNPFLWPRIYEANMDRIDDPHWIYPGQALRIPDEAGNIQEVVVVSGEPGGQMAAGDESVAPMRAYREPARTRFWRDTAQVNRAAEAALAQWLAVPQSIFYSAPFLDFSNGQEALGRISGFEGAEEVRTPRDGAVLYDRVILSLNSGAMAPGTRLQAFALQPSREEMAGLVAIPTAVLTVLHRDGDGTVASVDAQYDRVLVGDLVRVLPPYPGVPGVVAEPLMNGPDASVLGYAALHELHQPGNFLFLDMGRLDGVAVGDELVVERGMPDARIEGRVQVVGVQDNVATARIVMIRNPVFVDGLQLRLDRKMPAR